MKILIILGLSLLSALSYRFGGMDKPFKSWMRDWICPVLFLIAFHNFDISRWYLYLACYILSGLAFSTYWDFIFQEDNFYFHGFMLGIASMPLLLVVPWWILLIRAVILAVTFGVLNWYVNRFKVKYSDWIEELSRGFLYVISTMLFLF